MTHAEYLAEIDRVLAAGPYHDNWASLANHPVPGWYYRGKLGIFIHWGIYSVPGFGNEWYSRNMYDPGHPEFAHHRSTYGEHRDFGYKNFIPMFKGERFDPAAWAALFREAGAAYVMPVCEHHDGFAMYATDLNPWNARDMGPCRDVAGELKQACEAEGLTFCASTHRAEHYFFMNTGRLCDSDVTDERFRDFYGPASDCPALMADAIFESTEDPFSPGPDEAWLEDWLVRTCELIDRYQPAILYFDWWIQNIAFKPALKKLAAYYYNRAAQWGREVTINYKHEAFAPTVATFDVERGALTDISPVPWQTDTAIGKQSWGYRRDNEYKSPRQIICDLIDIVSKNGMLLLNVGPRPDGTITDEETAVLKALGAWLKVNGEGIYDTVPWKRFGEGSVNAEAGFFRDNEEKPFTPEDFRFTCKNGCVYAFCMRPAGTEFRIRSLSRSHFHDLPVGRVTLLGSSVPTDFAQTGEGLLLRLKEAPAGDLPVCFRIEPM